MIAGRAPLPGRDHLARLTMIVTDLDRCAIEPVGPNHEQLGDNSAGCGGDRLGTSVAGGPVVAVGLARPAHG